MAKMIQFVFLRLKVEIQKTHLPLNHLTNILLHFPKAKMESVQMMGML